MRKTKYVLVLIKKQISIVKTITPKNHETYASPASARSSALSKSASTIANLRATCMIYYTHK